MKHSIRFLLVTIGFLGGCTSTELHDEGISSSDALFTAPTIERNSTPITIRLPNLDAAMEKANLPKVKYAAALEELDTQTQFKEQRTNYRIWLGKLSKAQCEVARTTYADGWKGGLSGVNCDAEANNRGFFLEDFATPVMQATLRRRFLAEKAETSRDLTQAEKDAHRIPEGRVFIRSELSTNCWSTAYEVLRRESGVAANYTVHNLLPAEVERELASDATSRTRMRGTGAAVKSALDRYGVAFGDYVIVRDATVGPGEILLGPKAIVHAGVFIDMNLLFERVGTADTFPMRFATLDNAIAAYPNADFEVRRLTRSLPHVRDQSVGFTFNIEVSREGTLNRTTILTKDFQLVRNAATLRYALTNGNPTR